MTASVKRVERTSAEAVGPEITERVLSFARGPGWDGYRAKAVTAETCVEALALLALMPSTSPKAV